MLCQCGIELLLGNRDPSKYASVPYEPGVCARSPHMAISQFGYLAQCHCREQQIMMTSPMGALRVSVAPCTKCF
jgi:hypothetical protein